MMAPANFPTQPFPVMPQRPQPAAWQATPPGQGTLPRTLPATNPTTAAAAAPKPKFRAQAPDAPYTPPPPLLVLPSPEQLGVGQARAAAPAPAAPLTDWNEIHSRLRRVGAVGFHLDQLSQGQWRATFLLPTGPANQARHIEAIAASESEAVFAALQRAESGQAARSATP